MPMLGHNMAPRPNPKRHGIKVKFTPRPCGVVRLYIS